MLSEHRAILGFIQRAKKAAAREKRNEVIGSLCAVAHHAKIEEEVLYPAALLAGVVARTLLRREVRA